ncbi:hypothetical protein B0H14DRAFT_3520318 [Mycena olivaceomarginata]|nr:hypothetical protein B0H14DRAFT_3520318 [Mycena olivaceomarginata]
MARLLGYLRSSCYKFVSPLSVRASPLILNRTATTIAPTSEQEMAALVSKVTVMSKLALDMTRLCIEINDKLPAVVQGQVVAALASPWAPFSITAPPDEIDIDAMFPAGYGEHQAWYVVCVGRHPGLYASYADADDQVRGVPNQSRKKKDSLQEALLYYRTQYRQGECERVSEAPPASHVLVWRAECVLTRR